MTCVRETVYAWFRCGFVAEGGASGRKGWRVLGLVSLFFGGSNILLWDDVVD